MKDKCGLVIGEECDVGRVILGKKKTIVITVRYMLSASLHDLSLSLSLWSCDRNTRSHDHFLLSVKPLPQDPQLLVTFPPHIQWCTCSCQQQPITVTGGESGAGSDSGAGGAIGDSSAGGAGSESGADGDSGANSDNTSSPGDNGDNGAVGDSGAGGDNGAIGDSGAGGDNGAIGDSGDCDGNGAIGDSGAGGDHGAIGDCGVDSGGGDDCGDGVKMNRSDSETEEASDVESGHESNDMESGNGPVVGVVSRHLHISSEQAVDISVTVKAE